MKTFKVIGDVHGNISQYEHIIEDEDFTIQLGDFGFKEEYDWFEKNIDGTKNKILFGNHDYYPYLHKDYSLKDWTYIQEYETFCIRGAKSIDQWKKTEGVDWFRNEEIKYWDFKECAIEYEEKQPRVVITHDCPSSIKKYLIEEDHLGDSITNTGLEYCLSKHQPLYWIFGHHHKRFRKKIGRTEFICLGVLESINIKVI